MTRVISIANQKGGVGKTTTVINIAVALAQMKQKVLVIDLDPQGSLTAGFGMDTDSLEATIYDVLLEEGYPVGKAVQPVQAYLDLLPANRQLAAAETELIPEIRRELILDTALKSVHEWYDFILIDCPPSLGLLTVNALCASSEVLVPLQCEFFAMRGLQMLLETVDQVKSRLNPNLELVGILATMYSTGTVHAREVLEEIQSVFGDKVFDVVIYKSIRFAEATVTSQAIVEYASRHKGAKAYIQVAKILLEQDSK